MGDVCVSFPTIATGLWLTVDFVDARLTQRRFATFHMAYDRPGGTSTAATGAVGAIVVARYALPVAFCRVLRLADGEDRQC